MARNLLQDMVKKTPTREKIVEKKVESIRPARNTTNADVEKYARNTESYASIGGGRISKSTNRKPKYRIYLVALVSIIFLLFALSYLFSGAKITLTPKVKDIPLNDNLSASKDGTSGLSFDLVVISGEESKTIQGGEMKDITLKATGTVLIYNSFSTSPQVFASDTKLEGSNGKIYKTSKKVTVPGMTKAGKPGNVEVGIYAAEAGAEYNSAPLDFKIVSLKNTSKYSKIFARSKGEITGGLKGKMPVVSSLDKVGTVSELKATLQAKLLKKVTDQIPDGFILYKDAIFLNIDDKDVSFVPSDNNMVTVDIKGTLYGFLLNEQKLTKKIVQDIIDKYDDSDVYIPNIRDLTFSLADKENVSFADVKDINFNLTGTPKIIWKIDEEKFVADLLGKKKSDFNQILTGYPSIDTAVLVIRPFWKTTFPDVSKTIDVIVNYPK